MRLSQLRLAWNYLLIYVQDSMNATYLFSAVFVDEA
jgi:hypothetical protein